MEPAEFCTGVFVSLILSSLIERHMEEEEKIDNCNGDVIGKIMFIVASFYILFHRIIASIHLLDLDYIHKSWVGNNLVITFASLLGLNHFLIY